jgi:hypothetical protein
MHKCVVFQTTFTLGPSALSIESYKVAELPPISEMVGTGFMTNETHIVAFGYFMDVCGKPDIYTCAASEAKEIQKLLTAVACEGWGPITPLYDRDFVEGVPSITLEELYERFAEEFEEPEMEPSKEAAEKTVEEATGKATEEEAGGGEEKET